MYKNLLIATDGSELAFGAVKQGVDFAKELGAKVTIVTVTESFSSLIVSDPMIAFPVDELEEADAKRASVILSDAAEVAVAANVACETVHVKDQYPAEAIIDTAKERNCDLIVMASHGRRTLARLLLGSQANYVVNHSTIPVLICR